MDNLSTTEVIKTNNIAGMQNKFQTWSDKEYPITLVLFDFSWHFKGFE